MIMPDKQTSGIDRERAIWERKLLLNGKHCGWTPETIQKYADAIKAENNIYGYNQEICYWQFAVHSIYYNRGVDDCIRMKEMDVASNFELLPSLYKAMSDVYDGVLSEKQNKEDE